MAYTTIDDPTKYFDVTLWTGTGGARTISGLNHKPDLIWTKTRSVAYNHMWSDSSRGFNANSEIGSNSNAAEGGLSADVYGYKSGHTSDGWTMVDGTDTVDGQEDGNTNQPSVTYVGWTWAANGGSVTTVSESGNNPGHTRQTSTISGFSIIKYTGTGAVGTIAHGLGIVPNLIILKRLENADNWRTYDSIGGGTKSMRLNLTGGHGTSSSFFNDTDATSSVFTVGTNSEMNGDGETYIAYVFGSIQGYSKIGSYKGNGNTDGAFVYTGFKPAWIMFKRTDDVSQWNIIDNKRPTYGNANPNGVIIKANASSAEETNNSATVVDMLSNGFKHRNTEGNYNGSGASYIYMAFAEHPFVSSEGVPTTAK